MSINRRFFLKSSGIALASFGALSVAPSFLQRTAFAEGLARSSSALEIG